MNNLLTTHSVALTLPIVFLQVCFLPGLISFLYFKLNLNAFNLCPVLILFSLTINYCLVVFLTTLGLFTKSIILTIFLIELIYLILKFKTISSLTKKSIHLTFVQFSNLMKSFTYSRSLITLISLFFLPGFLSLALFSYNKQTGFLQIFTEGDAVLSWNKWAISWSIGQIPQPTFAYPQLFTSNWSLSYVLFDNPNIEFFNVALMHFFSLLSPIAFVGLGLAVSSFEVLFGSAFCIYLIYFAGSWAGYMDIPVTVAVAILFSTYFSLNHSPRNEEFDRKNLIALGLLSGGMMSVKQSSVFAFSVLCILLFFHLSSNKNTSIKVLIKSLSYLIFPAILIPGIWYFTKYLFVQDLSNNLAYLTSDQKLHNYLSPDRRIFQAFKNIILPNKVLVISLVLACLPRKYKSIEIPIVLFTFILPWLFLWAAFFSYDGRNLVLIYSLLGLIAGSNLFWFTSLLLSKVSLIIPTARKSQIFYLLTIALAFFYLSFLYLRGVQEYSNDFLNTYYIQTPQLYRGDRTLNAKILKIYSDQDKEKLKFASDDTMFDFIPELKERHKYYTNPEDGLTDNDVGYIILRIKDCSLMTRKNLDLISSVQSNTQSFCLYKKKIPL
ncbi:MAG: hypothetical protein PT119_11365 [Aphanizomenon gracile PMC627.10]|nr:hypothetical protein [Aphanizomenon gracile PMC627.10]